MTSPYRIKKDCYSSHRIVADYLISQSANKVITVLDLGCDTGFIGTLANNPNIRFTGADISSDVLNNLPGIYGYKIKLNLNDEVWALKKKYDYVVFTDVIEHLINPSAALSQISRLLKTESVLILSVPNFVFILARLAILFGLYPRHSRGLFDKTHLHHYTLDLIKDFLENSGFKIIKVKYTNPPIRLVSPIIFSNPVGDIFYHAVYFLVRLMPKLFAYQFILFCQKR